MKSEWQSKKLGEIFQIERGGSPRPIEAFLTTQDDGINWIKIGDTKNISKYIYQTSEKIKPEGLKKSRLVEAGDFLLSNSMSFGRPYIMKTTGAIHDGWLVLRKKMPNIDTDFFYHLLGSPIVFDQFDKLASGSTVRNLNTKLVSNVLVRFPPLSEQQRIVKILDEAFEAIEKAKENVERNLRNADQLFESYLNGILLKMNRDLKELRLGEVYDVRDGTHDSPKYQKDGYALITSKNLKKGKLDYQNIKYISEKDYLKISERSKVHKGDILFAMIGTIGNPVLVDSDPDFAIKNVALFKVPREQDGYFLKYFLGSGAVVDKMISEANGTTQKFVGLGYLRNFKIPLPPLSEQRSIVARLDALSAETKKLEAIYQRKLACLEELKKSLLQKAFAGDL